MNTVIQKNIGVVVLAAGKGTRLGCFDKSKVMLELAGKPMVAYTVETLEHLGFSSENIVLVVGFFKEKVMDYFGGRVSYAEQTELMGTAHAAYTGMQQLPPQVTDVLVMGGDDSAFYTAKSLGYLIDEHLKNKVTVSLLSVIVQDPGIYGRVVRHHDGKVEIIEKEYVTEEQKKINEVSTGTFCFNRDWFVGMYPTMPPLRKLGEYVLPTAFAVARDHNLPLQIIPLANADEWFGVNTPEELAEANRRKENN